MPNEPELTDADLAEIERLMHHARGPSLRQAMLYGLAAGYRRGVEDAARYCDKFAAPRANEAKWAAEKCAAAIRKLASL